MFDPSNSVSILVPVIPVIALTFIAFVKMELARGAAMAAGQNPDYYRAYVGDPEPEATVAAVRHWNNLFEVPTVFYSGCLTAFVLGSVSTWMLAFAWTYVAARIVQSAIHMTYNHPIHRGVAFLVGVVALAALWSMIALAILHRL